MPADSDPGSPHDVGRVRDELSAELVSGGSMGQLGMRGVGLSGDGVVLMARPKDAPAVLAAAQARYPDVTFEIIELHGDIVPV